MISATYPMQDRINVRKTFRMLDDLAFQSRQSREQGAALPEATQTAIAQVTGLTDPDAQTRALLNLADHVRADHMSRLRALAPNEFNAFCEYITPEEPPESRWHIFLTSALQESAETTEYRNLLLNCPPGHAKPVDERAWVLMKGGARKRLFEIEPGDEVITHTGATARVMQVHEQGELETVEIVTQSGRVLRCALDHPVFADGTFIEARDLRPGMTARSISRFDPVKPPRALSEYALSGLVCARGSHTRFKTDYGYYSNYKIITADEDVAQLAAAAFHGASLAYSYRQCSSTGLYHVRLNKTHDAVAPEYDWESRHEDKFVPAWVFEGGEAGALAFVQAFLFAAGECPARFKHPRVTAYLRHYELALGLQQLLARLGVAAVIERGGAKRRVPLWIGPAGIARLNALGILWGGRLKAYVEQLKAVTADGEALEHIEDVIVSVRWAGEAACRCLTLDHDDHSFIADGLAVHNSTYASRLFIAWQLGRDPDMRVIGGGHSQNFVENEFSKKIRNIVGGQSYQDIFPGTAIDHSTRAAQQWALAGRRGQYVARGVGQGIHGFRADFICVDDPYSKVKDAESPTVRNEVKTWFISDIGSRILPFGKTFVIMTRFHEDDLTGTILEMNERLPVRDRYRHIDAPAICYDPENDVLSRRLGEVLWDYYSLDYFQTKKITEKYHRFALIYQQLATATADGSIAGFINYYQYPPHADPEVLAAARSRGEVDENGYPKINLRNHYRSIVASVDTASKKTERADYSVVQIWAETYDGRHFLLDQFRDKVLFTRLIEKIESLSRKWDVDVILVEDKGQGTAYIQARGGVDGMRRLAPAPVEAIQVNANEGKTFRFDEVSPLIEERIVYVPADRPWTDAFTRELGQFPDGAHDDQVDAMTQYLRRAKKNRRRGGSRKVKSMG